MCMLWRKRFADWGWKWTKEGDFETASKEKLRIEVCSVSGPNWLFAVCAVEWEKTAKEGRTRCWNDMGIETLCTARKWCLLCVHRSPFKDLAYTFLDRRAPAKIVPSTGDTFIFQENWPPVAWRCRRYSKALSWVVSVHGWYDTHLCVVHLVKHFFTTRADRKVEPIYGYSILLLLS